MNKLVFREKKDSSKKWVKIKLKEITHDIQKINPKEYPTKKFQYCDINSIDNQKLKIINPKNFLGKDSPSRARQLIQNYDILFSTVRPYLHNIAMVPKELHNQLCSTGFCVLRFFNSITSKLIFYMIQTNEFMEYIKPLQKGTSYPAVRNIDILNYNFQLPPFEEQKRIVIKIEELFSQLDSVKQLLEKTKYMFKQYRSSILKQAFEGNLVPQDPNDDSASVLLEKIRHTKSNIQTNLSTNELVLGGENLPKNWEIVELQQVSKIIDSLHVTPKYSLEGIPMVRSTEIKYGDLNLKHALRVSQEIYENFTKNHKPKRNDIVMSRVGTYFVTSFVNTDEIFCMGQNTLVIHPMINPCYLYYVLNSRFVNNQIEKKLVGTSGQRTISLKNIRELLIFVSPLNEQIRIVEKIEKTNYLIQNGEKQIDLLLLHINLTKITILHQAFEGKLVTQDPNDEPAEILLQKIKQEKEQLKQKEKSKKRKKNGR